MSLLYERKGPENTDTPTEYTCIYIQADNKPSSQLSLPHRKYCRTQKDKTYIALHNQEQNDIRTLIGSGKVQRAKCSYKRILPVTGIGINR